jgi:hypothetical protein
LLIDENGNDTGTIPFKAINLSSVIKEKPLLSADVYFLASKVCNIYKIKNHPNWMAFLLPELMLF